MPISSDNEDKIGISQCASELKNVIKNGAQSIAVTSDFGGGKSSLIRYLESKYSGLTTKFCYINLWSQMRSHGSRDLHKSFIYQLASQISTKKGNYVSRRLSENYGMIGITLPSTITSVLSFIMFFFLSVGFVCTTLYDTISQYLIMDFYQEYHTQIGLASFLIAGFLAIVLLYNADIIFSSKSSEANRRIDEHELIDIYKTYICRFHFKHYIIVIEDLDRSEKDSVNSFIKELRRYYIPCRRKRSHCAIINWINQTIFQNINRVTFIVNIKSEHEVILENDENLYSKAFDYVLNLKEINIDNYDIILQKLLEDHRKNFKRNGIPAFDSNDKPIPEFEWIIRGEKIGIREIKKRLSIAISTYVNLCSKFNEKYISLKKCIAAAYIVSAFENEYVDIKDIGFDTVIDLYVSNHNFSSKDISKAFEGNDKKILISDAFASDIKTLISNGLIATDYRQYFFNFPADSHLRSDKQNKLINIMLYEQDISNDETFSDLVVDVVREDENVVIESFKRLDRLGKYFPICIFYSKELFDIALKYSTEKMFNTLSEKLQYDDESITATGKILIDIIKKNLMDTQNYINIICDIVSDKASPRSIIVFRRLLIENFYDDIFKFKSLFFGECPLITKAEVDSLKENVNLIKLINLDSSELNMELIQIIHTSVVSGFNLTLADVLEKVADFYEELFATVGTTEKNTLTRYLFEILSQSKIIDKKIEKLLITNNDFKDIEDQYIRKVCLAEPFGAISENTLKHLSELKVSKNLTESVCIKLKNSGYYRAFVINACFTNINLINFEEEEILRTVKGMDFNDKEDESVSHELLFLIRSRILSKYRNLCAENYRFLFAVPNPIITEEEIALIINKSIALDIIDKTQIDEENGEYIINYFGKYISDLNESYEILCFICDIEDEELKRTLFLKLDFDKIQYYRIAAKRKKHIIEKMSVAFDFEDISEQITYMTITKTTNGEFEKNVKKAIAEKMFDDYQEKYAEYVRVVKQANYETINNLCALNKIYKMPRHILDKLFAAKKFTYYVASKTQLENEFVFESENLELLETPYEQIFLSGEDSYKFTKEKMSKNEEFVLFMHNKRLYVDTPVHNRKLFANCLQSLHCLQNLFENYECEFIVEYLRTIGGFEDKDAAMYFIEKIKESPVIAADDTMYNNNHNKLIDSSLKGILTRFHNVAKES